MIDLLLTRRFFKAYAWPNNFYVGLGRRSFMAVPTVKEFVEERERPDHPLDRTWDLGRVRFFIEHIEAGKPLDPIIVDNYCNRGHVYPEPVLIDGHHRLIAAKVTRLERIPANYSGRVDLLDYLTGKRRNFPKE